MPCNVRLPGSSIRCELKAGHQTFGRPGIHRAFIETELQRHFDVYWEER